MGFYEERILPRLINRALDTGECKKYRERTAAALEGTVLEVGFGSGLNLPFYPQAVEHIHAIDPSELGRELAAERVAACQVPVSFAGLDGQRLPMPDASVDAVLSTWTLCTIPDVDAALREILRVLKPGASLHFLEHGRSAEPGVARWQDRINPVQRLIGGGCNLNRVIDRHVEDAGLRVDSLETFYMKGPRVFTYMFAGVAVRP